MTKRISIYLCLLLVILLAGCSIGGRAGETVTTFNGSITPSEDPEEDLEEDDKERVEQAA